LKVIKIGKLKLKFECLLSIYLVTVRYSAGTCGHSYSAPLCRYVWTQSHSALLCRYMWTHL